AFVAPSGHQCLAERDADILDRVMGVDMQVAAGLYIEIDQAVAGDLFEHVIEKADAGGAVKAALAVEINADCYVGFACLPCNGCATSCHVDNSWPIGTAG